MKKNIVGKFFILFVISLISLLLFFDFQSGRNTGGDISKRGGYYVTIIAITCSLGIYLLFHFNKVKINVLKALIFLFLYIIIQNFFKIIDGNYYSMISTAYSFLWICLIAFGYNILKRHHSSSIYFQKYIYLIYLFSIFSTITGLIFYRNNYDLFLAPGVYTSLVFYPWLLVMNNSIWKKLGVWILIFVVVLSLKRGAIIALFAMYLTEIYLNAKLESLHKSKSKNWRFILGIIVISLIILYVDSITSSSLTNRFSLENLQDGSGRKESNEIAINGLKNIDSLKTFIFGFEQKGKLFEGFIGHNDWLTFMINYGLIGFVLYGYFYYLLFKRVRYFYNRQHRYTSAYASLFILMFLMSLYSTSYNPSVHPIFTMLLIGFLEGSATDKKLIYENKNWSNYVS